MTTRVRLILGLGLASALAAQVLFVPIATAGTIFFDDFRGANELAERNWDTKGSKQPMILDGERACADVQTGALYTATIDSAHVRVSYSFSAAGSEGFETYVVAGTGSQLFIVGCDGGYGHGQCTPTIRPATKGGNDTVGPSAREARVDFTSDTPYRIEADFNDGLVTLQISDASGQVLATAGLSLNESFSQFGFEVGRMRDAKLSCVDDFRIEELD